MHFAYLRCKQARFGKIYHTQTGADIADILTAVIATCAGAQVNPYEYLTALQRHRTPATP